MEKITSLIQKKNIEGLKKVLNSKVANEILEDRFLLFGEDLNLTLNSDLLKTLVEYGGNPSLALLHAILLNDLKLVKYFLNLGADVNYLIGRDSPLLLALKNKVSPKIIQLLIEKDADLNTDPNPLYYISNLEGARLLLEAGADPNQEVYGQLPISRLASSGNKELVRLLLDYGSEAEPEKLIDSLLHGKFFQRLRELKRNEALDITRIKADGTGIRKIKFDFDRPKRAYVSIPKKGLEQVVFNFLKGNQPVVTLMEYLGYPKDDIDLTLINLNFDTDDEIYRKRAQDLTVISKEDCSPKGKNECLNSDTCYWKKEECLLYPPFSEVKLSQLFEILKPYKFYHLSETPLSKDDLYSVEDQEVSYKPDGFWFAVGNEWLDYILNRNLYLYRSRDYLYLYEVEIEMDKFILLRNLEELWDFSSKYRVEVEDDKYKDFELNYEFFDIDWEKIVKENPDKAGILIPFDFKNLLNKDPNQRMKIPFWYATFDIGSGVAWSPEGIKNLQLIYEFPNESDLVRKDFSDF